MHLNLSGDQFTDIRLTKDWKGLKRIRTDVKYACLLIRKSKYMCMRLLFITVMLYYIIADLGFRLLHARRWVSFEFNMNLKLSYYFFILYLYIIMWRTCRMRLLLSSSYFSYPLPSHITQVCMTFILLIPILYTISSALTLIHCFSIVQDRQSQIWAMTLPRSAPNR